MATARKDAAPVVEEEPVVAPAPDAPEAADESTPEAPDAPKSASEGLPADALAPGLEEFQKAVTAKINAENEQGFRGTAPDPTPNHNYTLAGVVDPSVRVPEEFKVQTGVVVYPTVHPDVTA